VREERYETTVEEIKMAGYLHRTATTAYPCYLPVLGEFSRSWSYKTCRYKYRMFECFKNWCREEKIIK